jgi:hypothetical protein
MSSSLCDSGLFESFGICKIDPIEQNTVSSLFFRIMFNTLLYCV